MMVIPLIAIPNQSVSTTLENSRYDIVVRACNGVIAVDIERDGVTLVQGKRAQGNSPLIPPYLRGLLGNIGFNTPNAEYPDYTLFGVSHFLVYLTPDEVAEVNANAV